MDKETKQKTITFGELKKLKVIMPQKWLLDLYRRYADKKEVKVDIKDLVSKFPQSK